MPATRLAVRITDRFRLRLVELRRGAYLRATEGWQSLALADLDGSYGRWLDGATSAVHATQLATVRLTDAYLASFLTAELGQRITPRGVDPSKYVGLSRDGRPLTEALTPPLLTVKERIGAGDDNPAALRAGLARALRTIALDTLHAARAAQSDLMVDDDRIVSWQRVARTGACLACLALVDRGPRTSDELIETHGHCQCAMEPIVGGVPDRVRRPSGREIFDAMTPERQIARYGEEKVELLRGGRDLAEFVAVSPMATEPDHVTEAPLSALQPTA